MNDENDKSENTSEEVGPCVLTPNPNPNPNLNPNPPRWTPSPAGTVSRTEGAREGVGRIGLPDDFSNGDTWRHCMPPLVGLREVSVGLSRADEVPVINWDIGIAGGHLSPPTLA